MGLFFLANIAVSTPRVGAYRTLHPSLAICQAGLDQGWTILSETDPARAKTETTDDNGCVDPSNDEDDAIAKDPAWATRFRCALQHHVVSSSTSAHTLDYYLGFLEFNENGDPYPLIETDDRGNDRPPVPDILNLEHQAGPTPIITQLDALRNHLSQGSNYVIVFIHGWQHNADIGDNNVADVRHYAAHVARFLKRRCETEQLYCDTKVTAIYVGWRGARVDETAMRRRLGRDLGTTFGTLAAITTLFDRKPVSEQVAPGAISALRAIERTLWPTQPNGAPSPNFKTNKMIVFGHSLGGNMLATGLQDDLVKMVHEHRSGTHVPPVLGNLVVLVNPATEAAKWTALQRVVWDRIPFHVDEVTSMDDVVSGHTFFTADQKPIVVSVTSALSFPPADLRKSDCVWLAWKAKSSDKQEFYKKIGKGDDAPDYDWATQELFPTFKFDFRPLSLMFERWEAAMQNQPHAPGQSCDLWHDPTPWEWVKSRPAHWLSLGFATFPFQNTNQEMSHTIGHLDPPRPADGFPTDFAYSSAAPFGTTHELFGLSDRGKEMHHPYATLADAAIECEPANRWLIRARKAEQVKPNGTFWDSQTLKPSEPNAVGEGAAAAEFRHGARLSGAAAITRANDPFWNMRAYDTALARHDGYRLSSFICAMNQLVMDDITGAPPTLPSSEEQTGSLPTQP